MYRARPLACIRESGWLLKYCLWNFVVRMNSAHDTAFQWIVLCFLVTSITAMVAPLDTAPTISLTSSCRISFSALRRSEEHTSELQSRLHLVCRLLLEKKKKKQPISYRHTTNVFANHS